MNKYFAVMMLMAGSFIAGHAINNHVVHADDSKHVAVKYWGGINGNPLTPEQFDQLYALQVQANVENHKANKAAMDTLFDQVRKMDRNAQIKAMHQYDAAKVKHTL